MKRVALSIKGGTAKGFGSIGIIRYLNEIGIYPEIIAGSSAGAIIAAMYCLGFSTQQMVEELKDFNALKLFSPFSVILSGSAVSYKNFKRQLTKYGEHYKVENFKNPKLVIFCSQESNARRYFIQSGNLVDAILASCAYPIYFPSPINFDGLNMLDGDLTSSFSTKFLKSEGAEVVIGLSYDTSENGPSTIKFRLLNRFSTFSRILTSEIEKYNMTNDYPDLSIKYSAEDVSYLDFGKIELLVQRGYESAKSLSTQILKICE